jgi:hypothetical protein
MKIIRILIYIALVHFVFYTQRFFYFEISFVLGFALSLFLTTKLLEISKIDFKNQPYFYGFILMIFSFQMTHIILRKTKFPFSNVGMYSNVNDKIVNMPKTRNLYYNGEIITTNARGKDILDDLEGKVISRLLRNNDEKIDSLILSRYPNTLIK